MAPFAFYTFNDSGVEDIETAAAAAPLSGDEVAPGVYAAQSFASFAATFGGESTLGEWRLDLSDSAGGDDGNYDGWSINFTSNAVIPEPASSAVIGLIGLGMFIRRRR